MKLVERQYNYYLVSSKSEIQKHVCQPVYVKF